MQEQQKGPSKSVVSWASGFLVDHWVALIVAASGVGMTALAAISHVTKAYGPVAWGSIGLLALLVASGVFALVAFGRDKLEAARYKRRLTVLPPQTNPLRTHFENERLRVADFFSPFALMNDAKTFVGCEFIGPGGMAFVDRCDLDGPEFLRCDLIALSEPCTLFTVAAFTRTTFRNCTFINATVLLPLDIAQKIDHAFVSTGRQDIPRVIGLPPMSQPKPQ